MGRVANPMLGYVPTGSETVIMMKQLDHKPLHGERLTLALAWGSPGIDMVSAGADPADAVIYGLKSLQETSQQNRDIALTSALRHFAEKLRFGGGEIVIRYLDDDTRRFIGGEYERIFAAFATRAGVPNVHLVPDPLPRPLTESV